MDTEPDGTERSPIGVPDRMNDTVILSQELLFALARHKDADVTVAVGDIFIDVCAVTYDHGRDKYVLHLMADDLADALRTLGDDPEPQADVGAEERGIAGHAAE